MNIRSLEYLLAIKSTGGFRSASEACHVSQPALSISVKKLEDELGAQLIERSNKGVIFTEAGQEVLLRAERILREVKELESMASVLGNPYAGAFALGAFPTLGPYYLPSVLDQLVESFPSLRFNLVEEKTEKLLLHLKEGYLDAALIAMPIEDKELEYVEIFSEPFYVGVGKNHRLAKKKTIHRDELLEERLLLLDEGHCLRGQAMEYCVSGGMMEDVDFRASSMPTLLQMISMGQAISFIPACVARQNPHLHYLTLRGTKLSRSIALTWRHNTVRRKLMMDIRKKLSSL